MTPRPGPGATPSWPKVIGTVALWLAFLNAQETCYLPGSVKTTFLAGGPEVVRIVFDAPSPLGLLSG